MKFQNAEVSLVVVCIYTFLACMHDNTNDEWWAIILSSTVTVSCTNEVGSIKYYMKIL